MEQRIYTTFIYMLLGQELKAALNCIEGNEWYNYHQQFRATLYLEVK